MNEREFPPLDGRESEERWRRFVRRRAPWQFRLRTLLLVVLVSSIGFGLLAFVVQRDRRHRQAVAKLEMAGAKVERDDHGWARSVDLGFHLDGAAADPRDHIAPDLADELVLLKDLPKLQKLTLLQTSVGDDELEHLAGLDSLRRLNLMSTQITDAGLLQLAGLTQLEELNLTQTRITNAGLEHLRDLENLKVLNLQARNFHTEGDRDPKITDAGLKHLRGFAKLEELNLCAARVNDAGLVHLKGLKNLRRLDLGHYPTKFDAAIVIEDGVVRLKPLSNFPEGTQFRMGDITDLEQITDAGLVHLSQLTKLEELDLFQTLVSDAGLMHLMGMPDLRKLQLGGTRVTDEGVEKPREALPNCRVLY